MNNPCSRAFGALAACYLLFGCGDAPVHKSSRSAKNVNGTKGKSAATADEDRCQTLLSGALAMMKPENLGVSADSTSVVSVLNNWAATCGSRGDAPLDPQVTKLLAEADQPIVAAPLFDVADVEHIRDCWLFQRAGRAAVQSAKDDVERSVKLFELSCRLVGLSAAEQLIPQMPYGVVVTGRGSAEDRAWVFAELLRQVGLDALIIRPKAERTSKPGDAQWLVGVPIDGQVYLFDPLLGWPVPGAKDDGKSNQVRTPATLAEVVADPQALDRLSPSAESPYRMKSADLKQPAVAAISSRLFWSPRMKRLQGFLSGDNSFTVSLEVGDAGKGAGMLTRLGAAGGSLWKKEVVTIWEYPARRLAGSHGLTPQQQEFRKQVWAPIDGPLVVEVEPRTLSARVTEKSRKLLRARVQHVGGETGRALMTYLNVQLDEMQPRMPIPTEVRKKAEQIGAPVQADGKYDVPREALVTNLRSAELGKYWMGVCQAAQGDFALAAETVNTYLRRYGQVGGTFIADAALLLGIAQAESKQYALAVASVNQLARALPPGDPRRPACELFANRWRALREADKSEKKPAEKSADAATTPPTPVAASPTPSPSALATPAARPAGIAPVVAEPPASRNGSEPKKS